MIQKDQLRDLITRVLKEVNLYSESAIELLMLTAAVESNLGTYIRQINGPALGIFQMEPNTELDIWDNYLEHRFKLRSKINSFINEETVYLIEYDKCIQDLEFNIAYQILMARIHYLRVPEKLPDAKDIHRLAAYYKRFYNTYKGKGTIEKAIEAYNKYCI